MPPAPPMQGSGSYLQLSGRSLEGRLSERSAQGRPGAPRSDGLAGSCGSDTRAAVNGSRTVPPLPWLARTRARRNGNAGRCDGGAVLRRCPCVPWALMWGGVALMLFGATAIVCDCVTAAVVPPVVYPPLGPPGVPTPTPPPLCHESSATGGGPHRMCFGCAPATSNATAVHVASGWQSDMVWVQVAGMGLAVAGTSAYSAAFYMQLPVRAVGVRGRGPCGGLCCCCGTRSGGWAWGISVGYVLPLLLVASAWLKPLGYKLWKAGCSDPMQSALCHWLLDPNVVHQNPRVDFSAAVAQFVVQARGEALRAEVGGGSRTRLRLRHICSPLPPPPPHTPACARLSFFAGAVRRAGLRHPCPSVAPRDGTCAAPSAGSSGPGFAPQTRGPRQR